MTTAQAKSCMSKSDKVDSLRRRIESLDETHRQFVRLRGQQATQARVLFVLGAVQDTAIAFLELAGQLGDVLPGKVGERVALAGAFGTAAINAGQSAGEWLAGTANSTDIALRSAESVVSVVGIAAKGPAREALVAVAGATLGIAKVGLESHRNNKAEAEVQAAAANINGVLDVAALVAKHKYGNEAAAKLFGLIKAANTYSVAITKRFTELGDAEHNAKMDVHTVEMSFKTQVRKLQKMLEEALSVFERECPDEAVVQDQIRKGRFMNFEPA